MHDLITILKASGEPSRLRILAILRRHELTVSELVHVLGQSQPRVSRHLRVLSDAGLLARQSEGTSTYYRLDHDGVHATLVRQILDAATEQTDDELARDAGRLREIRERRARAAADYFQHIATDWDRVRNLHVPDEAIEAALAELVDTEGPDDLLDLGTGTGRILELAGPHVRRGIGVDSSRDMLAVARDKLERGGLSHCHVRLGDIHNLDVAAGAVDMAVMHHVLHFLDDPHRAIAEAARTVRPGGLLVIVDFAPHSLDVLREDFNHVRLGYDTAEIEDWCRAAGLDQLTTRHFVPPEHDTGDSSETLTVTMWTARRVADTEPATPYELEVA